MRNGKTIMYVIAGLVGGMGMLYSCKKITTNPAPPEISLLEVNPRIVIAANPNDTVYIRMTFKDKNGDVGIGGNSSDYDMYLIDSRDKSEVGYRIPQLPSETNENKPGLQGTIILAVEAAFLNLREDSAHLESDTLTWDLYIKDLAGHHSNTITTPEVILKAK